MVDSTSGLTGDYRRQARREQIRRMRSAARLALRQFELDPTTLSLIQHLFNTTFKVTGRDGTRYVLHMLRPELNPVRLDQQLARVESELWWADRVGVDLGLSVPVPVRAPSGAGVVRVPLEGETRPLLCTLFHWVDGRFLRHRILPRHLHGIGRMTARLHGHSETLSVPPGFERQVVDGAGPEIENDEASLFSSQLSSEAAGTVRRAFRRAQEAQSEVGSGRDVFGLIHADIHQKNYLFWKGEIGLIDFGDCGWGHMLYDFAVTLNEVLDMPRYPQLRAALLAGYREVRSLSARDENLIDAFIVLRQVQDLTWFLRERHDPTYSRWSEQVKERVARLQHQLAG